VISGKPVKESVVWYGPIVMDTREELRTAFEEYQQGTFLKQENRFEFRIMGLDSKTCPAYLRIQLSHKHLERGRFYP
jgi:hypothetical protein